VRGRCGRGSIVDRIALPIGVSQCYLRDMRETLQFCVAAASYKCTVVAVDFACRQQLQKKVASTACTYKTEELYCLFPERQDYLWAAVIAWLIHYRARQLYKNISMLFLFPVKDGKLSTGSMQHLMHHVTVDLQQSKMTLQNNCINNTSIIQPTLSGSV